MILKTIGSFMIIGKSLNLRFLNLRSLNIIIVMFFACVLASCGTNGNEANQKDHCDTFDEIFHVGKLKDSDPAATGSLTKDSSRLEICTTDPVKEVKDKLGNITTAAVPGTLCMGITSWVYSQVKKVVEGSSEDIWTSISGSSDYKNLIASCIVLVIMFYGLMVMLGMTQVSGYSALLVFLKIALVFLFATQWGMFDKYIIQTFEAIVNQATQAASNVFVVGVGANAPEGTFQVLNQIDLMISFLWDPKVMKITLGLFSAGATGAFWGIGLFAMTIMYLIGVLNALKIFIVSLVGRYVLYALGPIFLIFALFSQTRSLFEGWMQQVISFTLQPVFLFIFLGIFHSLMAGMILNLHKGSVTPLTVGGSLAGTHQMTTAVCTFPKGDGKPAPLEIVNCKISTANYALCRSPAGNTTGTPCKCETDNQGSPTLVSPVDGLGGNVDLSFIAILSIIIISYMLLPMVNWVTQVAAAISGGNVSAASATIPGMNRVESEVNKGMQKIKQSFTKDMGGGDSPR
jgi:type IV secretory pathway VirB6-like protein